MKRTNESAEMIIGLCLLLLFGYAKSAYAYIDPGTGSYLFQIVMAGLLVVLFSVKSFLKLLLTRTAQFFRTTTERLWKKMK